MGSFAEFRKQTGIGAEELAELTGYTRQALTSAFRFLDYGMKPSKRFFRGIETALNMKIEKETQEFNQRIESLNAIKSRFSINKEPIHKVIEINEFKEVK